METYGLEKYGITGIQEVVYNPTYEQLFEAEMDPALEGYEKGQMTELGAVNVMTGIYTGRSPRVSGGTPHASRARRMSSLGRSRLAARLLSRVLRRRAKAAFTTRKKWSGSSTSAGTGRGTIRTTADVTLGAGRKHSGPTAKSSSGAVWYWQNTEKAP